MTCVCQAWVQLLVPGLKGGCGMASPISLSSSPPFQNPQSSASGHVSQSSFSLRFPGGSPEGPELGYLSAPNGESRAPVSARAEQLSPKVSAGARAVSVAQALVERLRASLSPSCQGNLRRHSNERHMDVYNSQFCHCCHQRFVLPAW